MLVINVWTFYLAESFVPENLSCLGVEFLLLYQILNQFLHSLFVTAGLHTVKFSVIKEILWNTYQCDFLQLLLLDVLVKAVEKLKRLDDLIVEKETGKQWIFDSLFGQKSADFYVPNLRVFSLGFNLFGVNFVALAWVLLETGHWNDWVPLKLLVFRRLSKARLA